MSGALLGPTEERLTAEEEATLRQMQADEGVEAPTLSEEPPPESTPSQESTPRDGEEAIHDDGRPRMVEKRALDEARTRARELQQRLIETERRAAADQARVEERLRLLAEAAQHHVTPPKAAPPDFQTDPVGAIQHGFSDLQERLARLETGNRQVTQQQTEAQAVEELSRWGTAQEEEFAQRTPDYREATQYLLQMRERQARAMPGLNPDMVRQAIRNDILQIAAMARQQGANLGQVLYGLAEASGYRKGGGPAPDRAGENAAERLLRGNDMATTIGSTGGAPKGQPGAQVLINMSDREWERVYEETKKRGPEAIRQLMGM